MILKNADAARKETINSWQNVCDAIWLHIKQEASIGKDTTTVSINCCRAVVNRVVKELKDNGYKVEPVVSNENGIDWIVSWNVIQIES